MPDGVLPRKLIGPLTEPLKAILERLIYLLKCEAAPRTVVYRKLNERGQWIVGLFTRRRIGESAEPNGRAWWAPELCAQVFRLVSHLTVTQQNRAARVVSGSRSRRSGL
jgi:hypothetical protein